MIVSFSNKATEDIYNGADTRPARGSAPPQLWVIARRKLDQLNRVEKLRSLSIPPGNRLEPLRGNRRGQHSIRVNQQYRICFRWEDGDAYDVEITDYH